MRSRRAGTLKSSQAARPSAPGDARYRATLAHLFGLRRFGMRPGLEVMEALLNELDHPERSFQAVHVAGSKGKGSVVAMTASMLQASGLKVGRFTSPHLIHYSERIQIDGTPIEPRAVVQGVDRIQEATDRLLRSGAVDRAPTFFEVTTALAFDWFAREGVEHAVVEVGLGGRLDSTNLLRAPVGVITTIELEHTEILGSTLTDIAREKAGILHSGMRAVVGERKPEPRREIDRYADRLGVPVWHLEEEVTATDRQLDERGQRFTVSTPERVFDRLRIPLMGPFQVANAALSVAAALQYTTSLDLPLPLPALRRGLARVVWRGRLEKVGSRPALYVDVAHTPESARAAAHGMAEILPLADPTENALLFGCLADKRVNEIFDALAPLARTIVLVPVPSERTARTEELRHAAVGRFARIVQAPSPSLGLALARAATGPDGLTLAVGSDYLVGALLRNLEEEGEAEPDLSDPSGPPVTSPPRAPPRSPTESPP